MGNTLRNYIIFLLLGGSAAGYYGYLPFTVNDIYIFLMSIANEVLILIKSISSLDQLKQILQNIANQFSK